ncbi:hypothetical protein SY83_14305 [Paenibacillus swuensis]|uniref:Maltodextrin-binding protein n=1 Tax=Paenibacillus swuensis TaxID=1178515 RepID=A0A172TK04_9BACL|nr:maltose ABC transporter substrate-binding protein [Paenibacillus swuensis]ANE47244.1 hypothetical protein SY83_14305 [Paenibacillus swuensis]
MKFRKSLVLLMAVIMVFTLAACGGGANNAANTNNAPANGAEGTNAGNEAATEEEFKPEEGAKLVVWDGGEQKPFIEEVGKAFQEKYGVEVTFTEVGADKSVERIITDGPAGVGADVFVAVHDRTGSAVSSGVVLPNDQFEEETKAAAFETAIQAVSNDGILYGYPKSVETTAVFFNKDLIPNVPATWDEVVKFAGTFNDTKANKFAYMWDTGSSYWGYGFFGGYGSYVFGKEGTDPTDIGLNNEAGIEAAKFIQSLTSIIPLKSADINGDIRKSLFTSNKLAMNVSGPWDSTSFKEGVKNLGVAPYPKLPNGEQMKPFSGVKAYFVNAYTKYPNAAKMFASFASSAEYQKRNYVLTGLLPSNKSLAEDADIKNDPIASGFLAQFANSVPMPSIPEMAQYWAPMDAALASLWNDKTDPKKAMDNAVQQMKDNISTGQ